MTWKIFFCISLMGISSVAPAFDIVCPEKIIASQKLVEPATGWREFVRPGQEAKRGHWSRLTRIDLYSGNPEDIAQLVPDNEEDTWTFSKPSTSEYPVYMACVYFDTYVQFVKVLPLNIKKCVANEGALHCEEFKP